MSDRSTELMNGLRHTLETRCAVLLRAVQAGSSDAATVIRRLSALEDTVIRQPPAAAQRALSVARDPHSSAEQLAAIFERDPALTESLLVTANSSYYHRGDDPRISIRECVQVIGMRGVEMVVTAKMAEGLLCRPGVAYAALANEVWTHMMRMGPLARTLAPAFDIPAETAFTVGLLHDAGKLIIFDYLSQLRSELRREIEVPERVLLDLLGRLHEPLGGIAALRWNLGTGTAEAIACHHYEPPPQEPCALGELLCVAERVDHIMRHAGLMDLDALWRECQITSDIRPVHEVLAAVPGLTLKPPSSRRAA